MPGTAQGILADRLRQAARPIAEDAKHRSSWSSRIPGSVRLLGGASRVTIAAGGAGAPHAPTFELGLRHPVFAHGPRRRGPLVSGHPYGPLRQGEKRRYDPPGWTWVPQSPRPFLRPAADAKADEMVRIFSGVIDTWAKQLGYK